MGTVPQHLPGGFLHGWSDVSAIIEGDPQLA
jgi:hypothetical protein